MLSNQAKSHVRKIRAGEIMTICIMLLLLVCLHVLMFADVITPEQTILACVALYAVYWFSARFVNALTWKKHVYNLLLEELNAPLFVEVLEGACKYDPFSLAQLQKLQAEGRYADMVSLCAIQLKSPTAKRYTLSYLNLMEVAYFHMGDDGRLKEVYEATERQILQSKAPAKSRKRIPAHELYGLYLKRDWEAIEAYFAANPASDRLAVMSRLLTRARLALLREDTEGAAELFRRVLNEAPNAPVAVVAKAHLEAIERGEGYDKAFPEALPDPLFPDDAVIHAKKYKTTTAMRRVIHVALIAMVAAALLFELVGPYLENRAEESYNDVARKAMEVDYDGVVVFGGSHLFVEEHTVESVAVCATDEGFMLVALYYLEDPDEVLCEPLVTLSEEAFGGDALPNGSFEGYVSDYYATYAFYASKRDLPKGTAYVCPVEIGGRTLWFAVTYVGQKPTAEPI